MKKTTWTQIFDIVAENEPMTKKDLKKAIEWAESEVEEYKGFIKLCKIKLKEYETLNRRTSLEKSNKRRQKKTGRSN